MDWKRLMAWANDRAAQPFKLGKPAGARAFPKIAGGRFSNGIVVAAPQRIRGGRPSALLEVAISLDVRRSPHSILLTTR
jgi:hypothetical protein